jgi:hypothetical protein
MYEALEQTLSAIDRLGKALRRTQGRLVRSQDERSLVKATALTWFQTLKPALPAFDSTSIDASFTRLLEFSEREIVRQRYTDELKHLKALLVATRSRLLTALASARGTEAPPDFSPLVSDPEMVSILRRRWNETILCMNAGAHLAALVMMGGLLEGLLLARVNQLSNLAPVFTAKASPKDKTGKTLPLKDWTLRDFIEVAHELRWIAQSAKDVGVVLRDYRNYVHPAKELAHGVTIGPGDTSMLWSVFQGLTTQIIASA